MKIKDLIKNGVKDITKSEGIYKVIAPEGFNVEFVDNCLNTTCNPYRLNELQDKYNKIKDKSVLYIGKANNLQRRIRQYVNYGLNKGKVHKGGRAIFQIKNFEQLEIIVINCANCAEVEKQALIEYKKNNGKLPLANWRI